MARRKPKNGAVIATIIGSLAGVMCAATAGYGAAVEILHNGETAVVGFLWGLVGYGGVLAVVGLGLRAFRNPQPWWWGIWIANAVAVVALALSCLPIWLHGGY